MSELKATRRNLPHWQLPGSTYFVTFHLLVGALEREEVRLVRDHVIEGGGEFYTLIAVTVMPDHVHILLSPNEGVNLSRITKGIKGVSSREINAMRGRRGHLWQDESFDRIVRDRAELFETLKYMLHNAAKRGLVLDPWKYEGWHFNRAACPEFLL